MGTGHFNLKEIRLTALTVEKVLFDWLMISLVE